MEAYRLTPPHPVLRVALTALCTLTLTALFSTPRAHAQEPQRRVVVLKVPGGGTFGLRQELGKDERLEVMSDRWFVGQIRRRGFRPRRFLRKTRNLKWVMSGAKIDLVILLKRSADKKTYQVKLYGKETAKVVRTFSVDAELGSLGANGAQAIREEVTEQLGLKKKGAAAPNTKGPDTKGPDTKGPDTKGPDTKGPGTKSPGRKGPGTTKRVDQLDPDDPETIRLRALAKKREDEAPVHGRKWLWLQGGAQLLKRDFSISSFNGRVLDFRSAFFPGYHLRAEVYPMAGRFGIYGTFRHGFDSITATDLAGAAKIFPIAHLQFELAPSFSLPIPNESTATHRLRLRAGVRHSSFNVADNTAIPATSMTQVLIAGLVSYPVFTRGVEVHGAVELLPLTFLGKGEEQFGTSGSAWGAGASLGTTIEATREISIGLFYDTAMTRSKFTGIGQAAFENAGGFELVQSIKLGVVYQK